MTDDRHYERYSPGDLLPTLSNGHTRRYAMVGDRPLTEDEIGARADILWARAFAIGKTAHLGAIASRLGLANPDAPFPSSLEALRVLAKAGVTWEDVDAAQVQTHRRTETTMPLSLAELNVLIDAVGTLIAEYGDRPERTDLLARLRTEREARQGQDV